LKLYLGFTVQVTGLPRSNLAERARPRCWM